MPRGRGGAVGPGLRIAKQRGAHGWMFRASAPRCGVVDWTFRGGAKPRWADIQSRKIKNLMPACMCVVEHDAQDGRAQKLVVIVVSSGMHVWHVPFLV